MESSKGKVFITLKMEADLKGIGIKIMKMEKDYLFIPMEIGIRGSLVKERRTEREYTYIATVINMKGSGKMIKGIIWER